MKEAEEDGKDFHWWTMSTFQPARRASTKVREGQPGGSMVLGTRLEMECGIGQERLGFHASQQDSADISEQPNDIILVFH